MAVEGWDRLASKIISLKPLMTPFGPSQAQIDPPERTRLGTPLGTPLGFKTLLMRFKAYVLAYVLLQFLGDFVF